MPWQLKSDKLCAYMPRKELIIFTCELPRVSHEIAHMVEMNNFDRLKKDDWGLIFNDWFRGKESKFDYSKFSNKFIIGSAAR
jgi:hypothetical protein